MAWFLSCDHTPISLLRPWCILLFIRRPLWRWDIQLSTLERQNASVGRLKARFKLSCIFSTVCRNLIVIVGSGLHERVKLPSPNVMWNWFFSQFCSGIPVRFTYKCTYANVFPTQKSFFSKVRRETPLGNQIHKRSLIVSVRVHIKQ